MGLYCTLLHSTLLYCTLYLNCTLLYCTVLCSTVLYFVTAVLWSTVLCNCVVFCSTVLCNCAVLCSTVIYSVTVLNCNSCSFDLKYYQVTMERDLGISKMLTLNPLLWNLLQLLALNKPALCYSSVIIRLFFIFIHFSHKNHLF